MGRPRDPFHQCPVAGCVRRVRADYLMCSGHWAMVPSPMAREVYAAYKQGPVMRHVEACDTATKYVNDLLASKIT